MRPANSTKPYYWINALERGLSLVDFLSSHPGLTVTEIARALQMDRSTCNRFLLTLKDLGYLSSNPDNRYRPTLRMFEIGNRIVETIEIRTQARTYMQQLAERFNETVNLGRLDGENVVTIDVVSSQKSIRFDSSIGSRSAVYTLAMGKAIMAFRSREEQAAYIGACDFKPVTPNTIRQPAMFKRALSEIRRQKYALDNEEWARDTRCIAVPIFDFSRYPSHAISISGPSTRITDDKVAELAPVLVDAGAALSRDLGGADYP